MRLGAILGGLVLLVVGLSLGGAGCAKDDARASFTFQVNFPSTSLAIATEKVQFIVYDAPEPAPCQTIYLKRITNQTDLPPVILTTPEVPMCDLALGRSPPIELPLGKHSILAIGLRGDQDLLVGCSDVALSSEGGEIVVSLGLPSTTPLPTLSACASLKDFCTDAASCK